MVSPPSPTPPPPPLTATPVHTSARRTRTRQPSAYTRTTTTMTTTTTATTKRSTRDHQRRSGCRLVPPLRVALADLAGATRARGAPAAAFVGVAPAPAGALPIGAGACARSGQRRQRQRRMVTTRYARPRNDDTGDTVQQRSVGDAECAACVLFAGQCCSAAARTVRLHATVPACGTHRRCRRRRSSSSSSGTPSVWSSASTAGAEQDRKWPGEWPTLTPRQTPARRTLHEQQQVLALRPSRAAAPRGGPQQLAARHALRHASETARRHCTSRGSRDRADTTSALRDASRSRHRSDADVTGASLSRARLMTCLARGDASGALHAFNDTLRSWRAADAASNVATRTAGAGGSADDGNDENDDDGVRSSPPTMVQRSGTVGAMSTTAASAATLPKSSSQGPFAATPSAVSSSRSPSPSPSSSSSSPTPTLASSSFSVPQNSTSSTTSPVPSYLVSTRTANDLIKLLLNAERFDAAMRVFRAMREHGVRPSVATYSMLMSKVGKWRRGTKTRHYAQAHYDGDDAYAQSETKHGALQRVLLAELSRKQMPLKAEERAGATLSSSSSSPPPSTESRLAQHAVDDDALALVWQLYDSMLADGVEPDSAALNALVAACARAGSLPAAERALAEMRRRRIAFTVVTYNTLISACGGDVERAFVYFAAIPAGHANYVTYTALIDVCGRAGDVQRATALLDEMKRCGVRPNVRTYTALIDVLGNQHGRITEAMLMLRRMRAEDGVAPNVYTYTSLISACGRQYKLDAAMELFTQMTERAGIKPNAVTYSALIDCAGKCGALDAAFSLFRAMREDAGIAPTEVTYTSLLHACGKHGRMDDAVALFDEMRRARMRIEPGTYTELIGWLGHAHDLTRAFRVFNSMLDDSDGGAGDGDGGDDGIMHNGNDAARDEIGARARRPAAAANAEQRYNAAFLALLDACGRAGELNLAMEVFDTMHRDCRGGNRRRGHGADRAAAAAPTSRPKSSMHQRVRTARDRAAGTGDDADAATGRADIDAGADADTSANDRRRRHRIGRGPSSDRYAQVDEASWTALLAACGSARDVLRAFLVFLEMKSAGVAPGEAAYNELLDACRRTHNVDAAIDVFQDMRAAGIRPSLRTFTSLMRTIGDGGGGTGSSEDGEARDGADGDSGCTAAAFTSTSPTATPMSSLLSSTTTGRAVPTTRSTASHPAHNEPNLLRVFLVFYEMLNVGITPDRVAFNALIDACARAGDVDRAFNVFAQMQATGLTPNQISYTSLIQACANAGEHRRAREVFEAMRTSGVAPPTERTYATVMESIVRAAMANEVCVREDGCGVSATDGGDDGDDGDEERRVDTNLSSSQPSPPPPRPDERSATRSAQSSRARGRQVYRTRGMREALALFRQMHAVDGIAPGAATYHVLLWSMLNGGRGDEDNDDGSGAEASRASVDGVHAGARRDDTADASDHNDCGVHHDNNDGNTRTAPAPTEVDVRAALAVAEHAARRHGVRLSARTCRMVAVACERVGMARAASEWHERRIASSGGGGGGNIVSA